MRENRTVRDFETIVPSSGCGGHPMDLVVSLGACFCDGTESGWPVSSESLEDVSSEIVECRKCPRLVRYREHVAHTKRAAFRDWEYWGRPVPGFGDPDAEVLIVGLAPAASSEAWLCMRPCAGGARRATTFPPLCRSSAMKGPGSYRRLR